MKREKERERGKDGGREKWGEREKGEGNRFKEETRRILAHVCSLVDEISFER